MNKIEIYLNEEDYKKIDELAKKKNLKPYELIKQIVMEEVQKQSASSTNKDVKIEDRVTTLEAKVSILESDVRKLKFSNQQKFQQNKYSNKSKSWNKNKAKQDSGDIDI